MSIVKAGTGALKNVFQPNLTFFFIDAVDKFLIARLFLTSYNFMISDVLMNLYRFHFLIFNARPVCAFLP